MDVYYDPVRYYFYDGFYAVFAQVLASPAGIYGRHLDLYTQTVIEGPAVPGDVFIKGALFICISL